MMGGDRQRRECQLELRDYEEISRKYGDVLRRFKKRGARHIVISKRFTTSLPQAYSQVFEALEELSGLKHSIFTRVLLVALLARIREESEELKELVRRLVAGEQVEKVELEEKLAGVLEGEIERLSDWEKESCGLKLE
jgi:hypothetical protein